MKNDSAPSYSRDMAAGMNAALFLISSFASIHEVCVRKVGSAGYRYAKRTEAGVGLLVLPWLAVFFVTPPTPGTGTWVTLHAAFLFMMACLHTIARQFRGPYVNTYFIGNPLVGGSQWRAGEMVLGLTIALIWMPFCPSIGMLHLLATMASRLTLVNITLRDQRILENMKDARLDAEYYASRMRDDR